ncbi:UTP--glucose-1-phosphate uridylyltransferase 3, chloroplastic-like [Aristolochia californica]|uniref:UTP--glucose-1-phosphate uridylyltransferase 3, chloroplastic-like n=1 Tax=Aristolochia californica TaxID=171875 RepID=UPI0035D72AF0
MASAAPSLCSPPFSTSPCPRSFPHFFLHRTHLPRWQSLSSLSLLSLPSLTPPTTARVSTVPVEYAPAPEFDFCKELARLYSLRARLSNALSLKQKLQVLDADSRVISFFSGRGNSVAKLAIKPYELFLLKCLVAAGQEHVLLPEFDGDFESERSVLRSAFYVLVDLIEKWDGGVSGPRDFKEGNVSTVKRLAKLLGDVEKFYDCIGGLVGYQITVLELLLQSQPESQTMSWARLLNDSTEYQLKEFHVPAGVDLSDNKEYASQAALWGIEGLLQLGEIYPLGGSGDRLGLVDSHTGECLPAAMLPYCGRTLLEGLIRDLQAREYLYYKIYGEQCITPVAIMTSSAKKNHERIRDLCERMEWFGRGQINFKLFEQPLVPAIGAEDGRWLVNKPFSLVCKPGGHGALWKLAYDKGVFQWFSGHGRKGATVRQVSNVVAATDVTLLALAGIGLRHGKKLGFASCMREIGATEGINVLVEQKHLKGRWTYGLTCIEYTEFEKLGIKDSPISPGRLQVEFPANTNILYVDLASAEKVGASKDTSCLPGMVLNLKKPVTFVDHFGIRHSVSGGRLECTMQNIADQFLNAYSTRRYKGVEDELDTFIVYNERRKVTSSAKRKWRHMDKSLHQTPDGSLLDLIRNASDLLSQCNVKIPEIGDNKKYLNTGPPFIILLHPALGPLWEVSRQKFHGGSISEDSELQLEVAEFLWRDIQLEGSLIVIAENIMGSMRVNGNERILRYGHRCGRCKLQNVRVLNKGIDWKSNENVYWKHEVKRHETCKVILHGNAEFEATDVMLQGNHLFEVPDGHKLQVTQGFSGLVVKLDPIKKDMMDSGSWFWKYKLKGTHFQLEMVEL